MLKNNQDNGVFFLKKTYVVKKKKKVILRMWFWTPIQSQKNSKDLETQ